MKKKIVTINLLTIAVERFIIKERCQTTDNKEANMSYVLKDQDAILEDLGKGVSRKILAYDENMMMVKVFFEEKAVGSVHSHPHEQVTYVVEGSFEFSIGDELKKVSKGDSLYFSPNELHGTTCIEKGILLDVFTPKRADFLT
jgi:quercetin dioxygenase-like cupin family protein